MATLWRCKEPSRLLLRFALLIFSFATWLVVGTLGTPGDAYRYEVKTYNDLLLMTLHCNLMMLRAPLHHCVRVR